jgi:hypothetical protein
MQFDSHRPLQKTAKFTLIRLDLLTGHPSICAQISRRWMERKMANEHAQGKSKASPENRRKTVRRLCAFLRKRAMLLAESRLKRRTEI